MSDLRQRYEEAFELWTGDTNARRALAEIAEGAHQQWQDEIRDQLGTEGEDVSVWVDRATVWVQTATERLARAEAAERRLTEAAKLAGELEDWYENRDGEWPKRLGARIIADLRRVLDADLDRVHAGWDHDDTRRFEHLAAADPEEDDV